MMVYYFTYGSNLSLEKMKRKCPDSEMVDVEYIEEHEIGFTTFSESWGGGLADVIEKKEYRAWGAIYSTSDDDLRSLYSYD